MRFPVAVLTTSLMTCSLAYGQVFQRELGDFDLKLGTTPTRSMAQGLVTQSSTGSFHGGLDLSHDSGWYAGQWSPSAGLTSDLEVDSYMGF
ncbi:TorF family putative porin, partial [Pseudomonas fluorescens]